MTDSNTGWRNPRQIVERVQITGDLVLETPTHFGSGDSAPWSEIQMTLLRDPQDGKALLPGASIAGALRAYLREHLSGYAVSSESSSLIQLFGASKDNSGMNDSGEQSLLLIDDALADMAEIGLKDGVSIDPATRTADEKKLFNMETLPPGTIFTLNFELLIPVGKRTALLETLALGLQGFERGEIGLGARKRRGMGRCAVKGWTVTFYDLTTGQGLVDWLDNARTSDTEMPIVTALLGTETLSVPDARHYFSIEATFRLESALLIRSNYDEQGLGAETAHLHVKRIKGDPYPIIPGTSWGGVIRHQALRIANTLRPDQGAALVDRMFGAAEGKTGDEGPTASRVVVADSRIQGGTKTMVQTRIKIDRFTGGTYPTALFDEAPIFGDQTACITLNLTLRNPARHEVGLLLLVLKDLWCGTLPLGGTVSVGRGRLRGQQATISDKPATDTATTMVIKQVEDKLTIDAPAQLEEYVTALRDEDWEVDHGTKD